MNWEKTIYRRLLMSVLLVLFMFFGGILVCKHTVLKDEGDKKKTKKEIAQEEFRAQREEAAFMDHMLMLDIMQQHEFRTMSAHSAIPEEPSNYEGSLSGQTFSPTDMIVMVTCVKGLQFVIISRRVGDNIALAVEQVRNTDNVPMLCTESY